MKVDISIMFEGNGNWWISVVQKNDQCTGILDTENYVELGYGKDIRSAVCIAANLRKTFNTGQKLLDTKEVSLLGERRVVTQEEINDIYDQVVFLFD